MINSRELSIFNRCPLKSAAGAVAVVRAEAGECAGLVSPTRWKRALESEWCDVTFYFFSGISIKVSSVDVGFVGREMRVSREGVKKFLQVTFVRKNIYASQVDCFIVEWYNKDHVTAWWREGEVPLWTLPREFRDVQLCVCVC